jgi:hypothetical protein
MIAKIVFKKLQYFDFFNLTKQLFFSLSNKGGNIVFGIRQLTLSKQMAKANSIFMKIQNIL